MLRPPGAVLFNIFLALIPVALAVVIALGARRERRATGQIRWGRWLPLLLVWLVFLPNTCYLLTEWRHYLKTIADSPLFDQAAHDRDSALDLLLLTGFYFIYSGLGLLTFFLAIWPLDRLTRHHWRRGALLGQAVFFALCALGVYLGLINRFNSWDLVHPGRLVRITATMAQVGSSPLRAGLVLGLGALLWALYALFDIWMDGALWRMRAYRTRRLLVKELRDADT